MGITCSDEVSLLNVSVLTAVMGDIDVKGGWVVLIECLDLNCLGMREEQT